MVEGQRRRVRWSRGVGIGVLVVLVVVLLLMMEVRVSGRRGGEGPRELDGDGNGDSGGGGGGRDQVVGRGETSLRHPLSTPQVGSGRVKSSRIRCSAVRYGASRTKPKWTIPPLSSRRDTINRAKSGGRCAGGLLLAVLTGGSWSLVVLGVG